MSHLHVRAWYTYVTHKTLSSGFISTAANAPAARYCCPSDLLYLMGASVASKRCTDITIKKNTVSRVVNQGRPLYMLILCPAPCSMPATGLVVERDALYDRDEGGRETRVLRYCTRGGTFCLKHFCLTRQASQPRIYPTSTVASVVQPFHRLFQPFHRLFNHFIGCSTISSVVQTLNRLFTHCIVSFYSRFSLPT